MTIEKLLNGLNKQQKEAVIENSQHILVMAGAGSGKTSVLTKRIAYQIKHNNIQTYQILAITFTNKAATEMKERIEKLIDFNPNKMWIGTFHGISNRLLRYHHEAANLTKDFQVLDTSDQLRLIKRLLTDLHVNQETFPPIELQKFINKQKEQGLRSNSVPETYFNKEQIKLYKEYEKLCFKTHAVDFTELLLRSFELLRDNIELRIKYQEQFKHILSDEVQDTNILQYNWIKQLTNKTNNLFLVGDQNQSIYAFRGSRPENINLFKEDFPNHKLIKLEQNYRSTTTILNAANAVISHNKEEDKKTLWTDSIQGEKIIVHKAKTDKDESKFIIEQIIKLKGSKLKDVAILYRTNAQSRQFEEDLMANQIPYKVHGGLRFYDRVEIKNALAYLRLINNRHDDISFLRVLNTPTRGIGSSTIDNIKELSNENQVSFWDATILLIKQQSLTSRASNSLYQFISLVDSISRNIEFLLLQDAVQYVIETSGLAEYYEFDRAAKSEDKINNLKELVTAAANFKGTGLSEFLDHSVLESNDNEGDADYVQLMTLHASKGLEFPTVFLVGLEEGLFPSSMQTKEKGIEEERRLMYVGITRAMRKLFITYSERRMLFGTIKFLDPSRFLNELPADCIDILGVVKEVPVAPVQTVSNKTIKQKSKLTITTVYESKYKKGDTIYHVSFGKGTVTDIKGDGENESLFIKFNVGCKWLMSSYL